MRIALLTDGIYPYQVGGMQKHSYYLAKYLAKEGFRVDLYHTTLSGESNIHVDCFSETELAQMDITFVPFPKVKLKIPGHYVYRSKLYSKELYRQLSSKKLPDFIYAQGFSGWETISQKRQGKKLPPIFVNFHGVNMFQLAPNFKAKLEHLLLRSPAKFNLMNADKIISLGGKLTEIQQNVIGNKSNKIVEIPIGIDEKWLSTASVISKEDGVRKFLFVGRYERLKGIEELTFSIKNLKPFPKKIEFHFVGNIPVEKQIEHPQVIYHGLIIDEERIRSIYADSDILLCPSYSEGMPTVILEAMASKMAIIATDVGAVSEQVSDKNGWIIPPANQGALQKAIDEAIKLDHEQLAIKKTHSLNSIEEKFTWEKVIKSHSKLGFLS